MSLSAPNAAESPFEEKSVLHSPSSALSERLLSQQSKVEDWFKQAWASSPPLFYGSVDVRNAGFKLSPVDTNLFPAGFNNLRTESKHHCAKSIKNFMEQHYPQCSELLLIPEAHTRNSFYFDNLGVLVETLIEAGLRLRLGSLNLEDQTVSLPNGSSLKLETLMRVGNKLGVDDFFPELILLNNDLSTGVPAFLENLDQTILPPLRLGWHNRLKSTHFKVYAEICAHFSKSLDLDPWLLMPLFDQCNRIDFLKKKGEGCLALRAEKLLFQIEHKYKEYGIQEPAFLIVKADAGTYGMGIMTIKDPQELLELNRKQRTKMSSSKGGKEVSQVLIQEGIYSVESWGTKKAVAEPVLYSIGSEIVGGFYRAHQDRGPTENLNAPGMRFYPFEEESHEPRFYGYSVVARLALLAAARE